MTIGQRKTNYTKEVLTEEISGLDKFIEKLKQDKKE